MKKYEKINAKLIYEFGLIIGNNVYYDFIKKEYSIKQKKCNEKYYFEK